MNRIPWPDGADDRDCTRKLRGGVRAGAGPKPYWVRAARAFCAQHGITQPSELNAWCDTLESYRTRNALERREEP